MVGDPGVRPKGDAPRHRLERDPRLRLRHHRPPGSARAKQEHAHHGRRRGPRPWTRSMVAYEVAAVLDQLVERANGPIAGVAPGHLRLLTGLVTHTATH